MADKCCDRCKHMKKGHHSVLEVKNCDLEGKAKEFFSNSMGLTVSEWDTSKDYCSKWEKKEDTLKEDISKSWVLLGHDSKRLDYVIKYFKQRIEESLEKADKETRESLLDITKNSFGLINTVKKHLGWILDQ